MKAYWHSVIAIYAKDLRLEARTKETISAVFVFAMIVAFVFNFAFDPTPKLMETIGPGIIWIAYIFSSILVFNRTFVNEKNESTIDGLVLAPISRDAIYLGKFLGALTIILIVEIVMIPIFFVMYDINILSPLLLLVVFLATVGFAAAGTIFSAIATNSKAREILLPLLLLPIILPVIIGAVASTSTIISGGGFGEISLWFKLMLAFDINCIVISCFVFGFLLEE